MTIETREARNAFYRGVDIGQSNLILKEICEELGIDYISNTERRSI